jgi:ribosomal protein S18 acetylase RimI-like enzyme
MKLEPAKPSDISALHRLIEAAYRGDSARRGWTHEADLLDGQRTDVEAIAGMLADPAQHLLLHRSDGELDGCIALSEKGDGRVYLGLVTVDPGRQGSGVGGGLLAAAEAFAARGLQALRAEITVIWQREELIAWYERRGYRRTGERRPFPYDDPRFGLPRRGDLEFVVLEKVLSSPSSEA